MKNNRIYEFVCNAQQTNCENRKVNSCINCRYLSYRMRNLNNYMKKEQEQEPKKIDEQGQSNI